MSDRVHCDIPGCPRTMGADVYLRRFEHEPGLWICSAHWGRLTKIERRVWSRIKRLGRKFGREAVEPREARIWDALIRRITQ